MRNRLRLAGLAAATLAIAAPLSAQVVHTGTTPRKTSGETVVTPPPAQPAIVVAPVVAAPARARIAGIAPATTLIVVSGDEALFTPLPNNAVIFANVPAFVLPDGRVFANFGNGIQQVIQPCLNVLTGTALNTSGNLFVNNAQPVVEQPVVIQPSAGASQPLPFTPNVPNQLTISQQMLVQALVTGPIVVNTASCFAANRVGQVFVTRP
jgi:hypothetical protein